MNRTFTHAVGGLENPMTAADPKPSGKRKAVDDTNPLVQAAKRPKVCYQNHVRNLLIEQSCHSRTARPNESVSASLKASRMKCS